MADFTSNLIGHWALDEGSGTTAHDSVSSANGTLTNGPTWSTDGAGNPVVSFDGVNDYINVGDITGAEINGDFSYFAMVNASALPGASQRMWIASKGGDGVTSSYEWELSAYGYSSPPKYRVYLYQSSSSAYMQAASATTCTTGADMHIGFTYKASTHTLTVYVNGLPDGSSTATTGTIHTARNATFQIGRRADGAEKTWKGTQRDERAYNRTLTDADVAALYASLTTPPAIDVALAATEHADTAAITASMVAPSTAALAATEAHDTAAIAAGLVFAPGTNVALAANGGTPSASSSSGAGDLHKFINDGIIGSSLWLGTKWWQDSTQNTFPDWAQVRFSKAETIDTVNVFCAQQIDTAPGDPNPSSSLTSIYALRDFEVQGWNGSTWDTLGSVSANTFVKKTFTFSPYTTDRVRVYVTAVNTDADGYSLLEELQAFTPASTSVSAAIAATEHADVAAVAGSTTNSASIAAVEHADVASLAAGASISAALAATEQPDSAAFAGATAVAAALASVEQPDTAAFEASAANQMSLAATEQPDSVAITAAELISAALAATEQPDTALFNSTGNVLAAVAAVEAPDIAALIATTIDTAAVAAVESADSAAVSAHTSIAAALAATEQPDSALINSSGSTLAALATTEHADSASFAAAQVAPVTVAATEHADSALVAAAQSISAAIAATEEADRADFGAVVVISGALAATEQPDAAEFVVLGGSGALIRATEHADSAAISASTTLPAALAATEAPDRAQIVATGLISGEIAAVEAADGALVSIAVVNVASVATTEQPDSAEVTFGTFSVIAALAATEEPDRALLSSSALLVLALSATEQPDHALIRQFPQVFPAPSEATAHTSVIEIYARRVIGDAYARRARTDIAALVVPTDAIHRSPDE